MSTAPETIAPMQLSEFCERLQINYRAARYVLEQGLIPKGLDPHPSKGNHRLLTAGQTYWLGFLHYLKQSGVTSPVAAQIADYAAESVSTMCQQLNYDPSFSPFKGRLLTERIWSIEVGDLQVIRVKCDRDPSGRPFVSGWSLLGKRKTIDAFEPFVTLEVNLTRLANRLRGQ